MSKVSTPYTKGLRQHSQSGTDTYGQYDIKKDIEHDLTQAGECTYDTLLQYFLYLILKEDSSEKKKLDQLQAEIEQLQWQRNYMADNGGKGENDGKEEKTDNDGKEDYDKEDDDDSEQGSPGSMSMHSFSEKREVGNMSLQEIELLEERYEIMDKIYHQALDEVLPIANNQSLKLSLNGLQDKLKVKETEHYGPFVKVSNEALDMLHAVGQNSISLPIRSTDQLAIHFQTNDPSHIKSYYKEGACVVRIPDVFVSSERALSRVHQGRSVDYMKLPPTGVPFVYPERLASAEFKDARQHKNPCGMMMDLMKHQYSLARKERDWTTLEVLDPKEVVQPGKTVHRVDEALNGDEEQPSNKKLRTPAGTPSVSRMNSATEPQPIRKKGSEGRVRCASYALEMMSYSIGVHHVINFLFTDGILWVWYYDHQGIIRSSGISIFYDFPCFLVLLLVLQHFSLENWGVIPALNPNAVNVHCGPAPELNVKGKSSKAALVQLELEAHLTDLGKFDVPKLSYVQLRLDKFLSNQPHCLAGRATAVVTADGYSNTAEADALPMVIYDIAKNNQLESAEHKEEVAEWDVLNHLPKFYFYGDIKNTTTHTVWSMVNLAWKGHHTMRMIGMKKLTRITSLSGWDFISGWLGGITCHAFLWKNFIEHGDPSVANLMFDNDTKCGVLTDFDLSILQWEPRVLGNDRTGTILFMSLDLLNDEFWEGCISRLYHHELESFIWMLPYVFFLYNHGKRQRGTKVDPWRTSSFNECKKEKLAFLDRVQTLKKEDVQPGYSDCWQLAAALLQALKLHRQQKQNTMFVHNNPIGIIPSDWQAYMKNMSLDGATKDKEPQVHNFFDAFQQALFYAIIPKSSALTPNVHKLLKLLNIFYLCKPGDSPSKEKEQELHQKYSSILSSASPPPSSESSVAMPSI